MLLTDNVESAIRITLFIAWSTRYDQLATVDSICDEIGRSKPFTCHLLLRLEEIGAIKRIGAGYRLNVEYSSTLLLSSLVAAVEDEDIYRKCGLGMGECSDHEPCPMHNQFKLIKNHLRTMLAETTINQLIEDTNGTLRLLGTSDPKSEKRSAS